MKSITWFQCTAFELLAIVNLPRGLRLKFAKARAHQMEHELRLPPGLTGSEIQTLTDVGIKTDLEIMCARLLSDRRRHTKEYQQDSDTSSREEHVSFTVGSRASHGLRVEKSRVEKKREEKKREEEILQPTLSDLDNAGAREAEPAPKPVPSFDEFQAMGKAVMEAQRKAAGIRSLK